jgi:aspartyl-tRNA(Asn)/glutamyl-tRNA(Gln) amidotransferase subunit A
MYLNDVFTIPANLAGLPALSLPCGTADGCPVGLQLIAPPLREADLLAVAKRFEDAHPFKGMVAPEPEGGEGP